VQFCLRSWLPSKVKQGSSKQSFLPRHAHKAVHVKFSCLNRSSGSEECGLAGYVTEVGRERKKGEASTFSLVMNVVRGSFYIKSWS
jgi:hypothetical protein